MIYKCILLLFIVLKVFYCLLNAFYWLHLHFTAFKCSLLPFKCYLLPLNVLYYFLNVLYIFMNIVQLPRKQIALLWFAPKQKHVNLTKNGMFEENKFSSNWKFVMNAQAIWASERSFRTDARSRSGGWSPPEWKGWKMYFKGESGRARRDIGLVQSNLVLKATKMLSRVINWTISVRVVCSLPGCAWPSRDIKRNAMQRDGLTRPPAIRFCNLIATAKLNNCVTSAGS